MKCFLVLFLCSLLAANNDLPTPVQAGAGSNGATCVFGNNVTSGNVIVVGSGYFAGTLTSIADTRSTSYTLVDTATGGGLTGQAWVGTLGSSGANTVTVTLSGGSFQNTVCAELKNVTATVDGHTNNGFTGTPSTITTSGVTTTVDQDIQIASFAGFRSGGAFTMDLSVPTTGNTLNTINGNDSQGLFFNLVPSAGAATLKIANATNDQGNYVVFGLKASAALAISNSALPNAMVGSAYNYTLVPTGGVASYTFSITGGSLPSGMSLNASTGAITGTPTSGASSTSITFHVVDGNSNTANKTLTLALGGGAQTPAQVQTKFVTGSNSIAMNSNVTAGNTMFVFYSKSGATGFFQLPQPPTDSQGTAYKLLHYYPLGFQNTSMAFVYVGKVIASGADTVTLTAIPATTAAEATEVSGVQVFDDNGNITVGNNSGSATLTSSSLTTLVPNEFLVGMATAGTGSATETANSPFTAQNTGNGMGDGYQLVSTVTGYTVSFAQTSNTDGHWVIFLDGVRPDSNGTTPPSGGIKHKAVVQ